MLEFGEFCQLAARFLVEEDEEALKKELKEAFRIYDKEGILIVYSATCLYDSMAILNRIMVKWLLYRRTATTFKYKIVLSHFMVNDSKNKVPNWVT